MSDHIGNLIRKYKRKGVLIDTNILLVYFVGSFNRDLIPNFKRTGTFTVEDFELIVSLLDYFEVKITTPNILTEVSNLLGKGLSESDKEGCHTQFAMALQILMEKYVASKKITTNPEFKSFGLTDIGIAALAKGKYLVFTDDLRVSDYYGRSGIDVLNFNHVRGINWH